MTGYHIPVMLNESIEGLNIKPNGTYIDCTLGEGGHSLKILKKLGKEGKLISIDQDQEALDFVNSKFKEQLEDGRWVLVKANFKDLDKALGEVSADGILMDIGVSSRQIDQPERGFSYQDPNAELDMRMDSSLSVRAYDLLQVLNERELEKLFRLYGEERFAKRIAVAIKKTNIRTVGDLTNLIYKVVPAATRREESHHPARRVFQALRIAVNDELNSLREGIDKAFKLLNSKGRLVVISFHSLEDRIVKEYSTKISEEGLGKVYDLIVPTEEEIERNPRSRTAKLRVIEKI